MKVEYQHLRLCSSIGREILLQFKLARGTRVIYTIVVLVAVPIKENLMELEVLVSTVKPVIVKDVVDNDIEVAFRNEPERV